MEQSAQQPTQKTGSSLPFQEYINDFFEYLELEKNVSKLTIRNYRHYLERFSTWYGSWQSPAYSPANIDQNVIRRYRVYLSRYMDDKGRTLARVTQNYHLIALRSFLKFLVRQDIKTISSDKIELGKAESKSLKFLSHEQVERLLSQPIVSTPQGLRDKTIMEVLFSTGLRVSELVALDRSKINFQTAEIGVIGKGGRPRVVFLSNRALEWLRKYLVIREDQYKPLFIRFAGRNPDPVAPDESFRLTVRSMQRIVGKYCRKAQLPVTITPHGIRHSFATDLLTNGADIRAIQEMLGHKNISTTQIYTHVTNPQLKQVHHQFHGK